MLGVPSAPVNTFDMVGKDRSFNLESLGYLHLKGVALRLHGNRDDDSEPHDPVIVVRRQDKRRSPSALLVPPHGIEVDRDNITTPWEKIFRFTTVLLQQRSPSLFRGGCSLR